MKYILTFFLALTTIAQPSFAIDQVPFGDQISSHIKNYNRASSTLATSGTLGEGAIKELAEKGVTTIIDLRTKAEGTLNEKMEVESAGMSYINIPVTGDGVSDQQLAAFTKIYEKIKGPVLLHCGSGNRVGAMLTRYYISKGISPTDAFERGRTAGMRLSLEKKIKDECKSC